MSAITPHINAWKWAVAGQKKAAWPDVVETSEEVEFLGWNAEILAASNAARTAGHDSRIGGKNNPSGGKKIWLACNGFILKAAFVPKPRIQAVTSTSRESYAKVNLGQKCLEVAAAAMAVQGRLGYATDGEVARHLGCSSALVSARRNDIEKAGKIEVENSQFCISSCGTHHDAATNRRVNAWRLEAVLAGAEQLHLF